MKKIAKTSQKDENRDKNPFFLTIVKNLISSLSERSQEIVQKRFGLIGDGPQTLEKIGEEYNVTRERVRQIIMDARKKVLRKKDDVDFKQAEDKIFFTIKDKNGIIEESSLIKELSNGDSREANAILFLIDLSNTLKNFEEKGFVRKSWMIEDGVIDKIKEVENVALEVLGKEKNVLDENSLSGEISNKMNNLSKSQVVNLMNVLEKVKRNNFGKWGLAQWDEIKLKGTRERIYVVLKEKNKPMHFTEIAKSIDQHNLGKRKSHPQTVHNELIKDERFVLIGRGIYALREWGYNEGTVKDVLEDILRKSKKSLDKNEILEKVLRVRKVKKSTIMINLNNPEYFSKEKNLYSVRK